MSADDLLQLVTQALFVLVFLLLVARTAPRPTRADLDMMLLFGVASLVVAMGWVAAALGVQPNPTLNAISGSLVMALPCLLLRLVDDFSHVPKALLRLAEAGLALAVVSLFAFAPPRPTWLTDLQVLYFLALEVYAAAAFGREAHRASGVTRRRMQAVAAGSIALGLTILVAGLQAATPGLAEAWTTLGRVFALASGVGYYLGFAPPGFLRRTWQAPELRAFLQRATSLPRLPDVAAVVDELERGAARSLGAPEASVGLWDESARVLRFRPKKPIYPDLLPEEPDEAGQPAGCRRSGDLFVLPPGKMIAGQAFAAQRPVFSADAARDDPAHAAWYRAYAAHAVLAAPITTGEKRLGVLTIYAARAPMFADDDLGLVQLLADQAAVILESRALVEEAARIRGREEAARLKDDFLSAAAHELKTPVTTLVAQAQLLELRAKRNPTAPADLAGVQRIVKESRRLKGLILELLDAARAEEGGLVDVRTPTDLAEIVAEACERQLSERHRCVLEAEGAVVGDYDRARIMQLVENLLENAVKYSPYGGEIRVKVWREEGEAHLTVTDSGIGISASDLPHVFDRFHRGANVDDRRFAGMGLGLFICRGIVEQHDGRISVGSVPGRGSTFHVVLPAAARGLVA